MAVEVKLRVLMTWTELILNLYFTSWGPIGSIDIYQLVQNRFWNSALEKPSQQKSL